MTTSAENLWWKSRHAIPPQVDEFYIPPIDSFRARPLPPLREAGRPRPPRPWPARTLLYRLTQAALFVGAVLYTALQLILLALAVGALPLLLMFLGGNS